MGFCLRGLDVFKGCDFLDLSIDSTEESNELLAPSMVFYERQFYDPQLKLFATAFDERVLRLKSSHDLVGFFQSEQYFFGDLEKLKHYIRIKSYVLQLNSISDDICVLNLRGGEYKRFNDLLLPKSYWENAKKNMQKLFGIEKFIVVTDDYRYAKALFPLTEIISGNVANCYATLSNAKYVIASNSSFSYFPLKTNLNNPAVIAPQYWARFNNSYDRWAAPANLYRDWLWQDANGNLHSYDDCLPLVQRTLNYYRDTYYVCAPITQFNNLSFIKKWIPRKLRTLIKSLLGIFFPTKIG
jgi:hypothetical protein